MDKINKRWERKQFEQRYGWKKPKPKDPATVNKPVEFFKLEEGQEITAFLKPSAGWKVWWYTPSVIEFVTIRREEYDGLRDEIARLRTELARRLIHTVEPMEEITGSKRIFRLGQ